jgi:hypothetical protein
VVVDQTLPLAALDELDSRIGAREVLIHELGHVLGADHEDDVMSAMCTAPVSCGKVGRRSASGGVGAPDIRSETRLPDDVAFAVNYHSSAEAGRIDAFASPWRYSSGPSLNYSPTVTRTLCPGQSTTVRFGVGNLGKVNISSANPVNLRMVISTDSAISTADATVATGTFWATIGFFGSLEWTVTIPNVPSRASAYHIGVIADPTNTRTEDDEFNNGTQTGLRIMVPTGC